MPVAPHQLVHPRGLLHVPTRPELSHPRLQIQHRRPVDRVEPHDVHPVTLAARDAADRDPQAIRPDTPALREDADLGPREVLPRVPRAGRHGALGDLVHQEHDLHVRERLEPRERIDREPRRVELHVGLDGVPGVVLRRGAAGPDPSDGMNLEARGLAHSAEGSNRAPVAGIARRNASRQHASCWPEGERLMARPLLAESSIAPTALAHIEGQHPDVVREVQEAVRKNPVVVVGMAQNPHVKNVRKALDAAGVVYSYLEYGSYFSDWRKRLAIKMWSGWPTFPQVFVKGTLIGGEDLTKAALADGSLRKQLDGAAS